MGIIMKWSRAYKELSDYTADVPGIDGERILREIYGDNRMKK